MTREKKLTPKQRRRLLRSKVSQLHEYEHRQEVPLWLWKLVMKSKSKKGK